MHLIGTAHPAVTGAVARTLAAVWPERLALRGGAGDELQDLVLLASDAPLPVPPTPSCWKPAGTAGPSSCRPPTAPCSPTTTTRWICSTSR